MIETCLSDFKCFNVKFYVSALVGVIIKVTILVFQFGSLFTCRLSTLISNDRNSTSTQNVIYKQTNKQEQVQVKNNAV